MYQRVSLYCGCTPICANDEFAVCDLSAKIDLGLNLSLKVKQSRWEAVPPQRATDVSVGRGGSASAAASRGRGGHRLGNYRNIFSQRSPSSSSSGSSSRSPSPSHSRHRDRSNQRHKRR